MATTLPSGPCLLELDGCQHVGPFLGTPNIGITGIVLGFYGDNGKEHGNYLLRLYIPW